LLSLLEAGGELSLPQALHLVQADGPPCPENVVCKPIRKDNPHCFCGLVPLPGHFKRKGLWLKEPSAVAQLGDDPALATRSVSGAKFLNLFLLFA